MGDDVVRFSDEVAFIYGLTIYLFLLALWSLPIIIACFRRHPHYWAILILTSLLGWTFEGRNAALQ